MIIDALLARLDGVRQWGARWSARCPAHADRSPSLSIREGADGRILLHDFGGCTPSEIVAALNLELKDLFSDAPLPKGPRRAPQPEKINRVADAFRLDIAALDLRLRASRIIEAGKRLNAATLANDELDHALGYVAQACADIERAELFEATADTLRAKEFIEREYERQQRIA